MCLKGVYRAKITPRLKKNKLKVLLHKVFIYTAFGSNVFIAYTRIITLLLFYNLIGKFVR